MIELMVARTFDSKILLTELKYDADSYSYFLDNPIIVKSIIRKNDETLTCKQFLPGTTQEIFSVPENYIISYALANEMYRQYYGKMMLNYFIQKEAQRCALIGKESFGDWEKCAIAMKKAELMKKYGILGESESDLSSERELH